MSNIYKMSDNVYEIELWNVNLSGKDFTDLSGHYKIYYNPKTGQFLVDHFGNFGSISWFPETNNTDFENNELSQKSLAWIKEMIEGEFSHARTYEDKIKYNLYPRNTIFDYDYELFKDLPGTIIGRKAFKILEGEV